MLRGKTILCQLVTIILLIKCGSGTTDTNSLLGDIYLGCADIKLCYGVPKNCIQREDCQALVTVSVSEGIYMFEVLGTGNPKYVAVGLSTDNKMGDDSTMECVQNDNGEVDIFTSWTYPIVEPYVSRSDSPQDIVQMISSSNIDGKLYCKFRRDVVSTVKGATFDLAKDSYNLMLVAGSGMLDADRVGFHNILHEVTTTPLTLSNPGAV